MSKIVKPLALFTFTTDSKDGRLLEINQGERSHVKTLDKEHHGDVFQHAVVPYLRQNVFAMDTYVQYLHVAGRFGRPVFDSVYEYYEWSRGVENTDIVFIPSYCGHNGVTPYDDDIIKNRFAKATLSNVERSGHLLLRQKAFTNQIASIAGVKTPFTKNYKLYHDEKCLPQTIQDICNSFKDFDHVVLKPSNEETGKGVVIIEQKGLESALQYLLYDIRKHGNEKRFDGNGWAEEYWQNRAFGKRFQIQEFVKGMPFLHEGKTWDSTERFLWTYALGTDSQGNLVSDLHPYGGFRKLPREPITGNGKITQKNAISFSYPHNTWESITRWFGLAASGSGDQVLIKEKNIKAETKALQEQLNAIFETLYTIPDPQFITFVKNCSGYSKDGLEQCKKSRESISKHFYKRNDDLTYYPEVI